MPNMEELISAKYPQKSQKVTAKYGCPKSTQITPIDRQNYPEASRHCVFSIIGGDFTGHYLFKKGFYSLSDIPTVFQEHIDNVLEI